jgi:hypothetical protein
MAVGQVSSITGEQWQLITTNTPALATSTTFSSLSGYKSYLVLFNSTTVTTNTQIYVDINGGAGAGVGNAYYFQNSGNSGGTGSGAQIKLTGAVNSAFNGWFKIDNATSSNVKQLSGGGSQQLGIGAGWWNHTDPVTSFTFSFDGTISGSFALYGIAA